jgi:endogenous inhibitor of DNA gyrase (YacG/DUF329 family)
MTNSTPKKLNCLICNKEFEVNFKTRPFCSKRCSYIDLNSWLGEKYSVQANEEDYEKDL